MSESDRTESAKSHLAGVTLRGSLRETMKAPPTVYEAVGGQSFFDDLVNRRRRRGGLAAAAHVSEGHPSRWRLANFLAQYWGGPPDEVRGHPRLQMRHLPFTIGRAEREAWMAHMTASLDGAILADGTGRPLPTEIRALMFEHFDNAATHLVNKPDDTPAE